METRTICNSKYSLVLMSIKVFEIFLSFFWLLLLSLCKHRKIFIYTARVSRARIRDSCWHKNLHRLDVRQRTALQIRLCFPNVGWLRVALSVGLLEQIFTFVCVTENHQIFVWFIVHSLYKIIY